MKKINLIGLWLYEVSFIIQRQDKYAVCKLKKAREQREHDTDSCTRWNVANFVDQCHHKTHKDVIKFWLRISNMNMFNLIKHHFQLKDTF